MKIRQLIIKKIKSALMDIETSEEYIEVIIRFVAYDLAVEMNITETEKKQAIKRMTAQVMNRIQNAKDNLGSVYSIYEQDETTYERDLSELKMPLLMVGLALENIEETLTEFLNAKV